ncbi:MAG: HYR domain-containing protein [Undibacterium sp.]|nr:HYR domain-containing protein [Opitutaceae bacterium]
MGAAQKVAAHGVQVAYGTTPTGFVRIYIEHWHGDETVAALGATNNINVTVNTGTTSSTFNVNVSGTVNNTSVGNLPGLVGPIKIVGTTSRSNAYNDWGYWDFAPGSCNQPVSITINQGNTVIFTEAESNLYPATIAAQTFTDQAAPVITAPDVTVVGDCSGASVSFAPKVVDDCDKSPVVNYSHASGSFFPVGSTLVTVTATDNTGKTSVKTFNVVVVVGDTTPPSLTVPAPILVTANSGLCGATVAFTTSATDNCSTATVVNSRASGSFFPVGTTTVTSVATDANGNRTTKTFTVTVRDTELPVIATRANIVANAALGACAANVTYSVGATDNCSGVAVSYSPASGSSFGVGTTVVTATATDAAGNMASSTFSVTVTETQPPTITAPAIASTVTSDGAGNTAALSAWLAGNGGATATDSCGAVTWSNNFRALTAGCGASGAATVVFTATDANGNASNTTATFTIVDTTAPAISPAAVGKTVESDGAGNTAALSAWLAAHGGANATDAGGTVTWTNNFTVLTAACGTTGATTVTFTATDACGNASNTTATFTIVDTTAPAISPAAVGKTVESDGAGNTAALSAWLAAHGGANATDAGGTVTWTNNFTALTAACGTTGATTVTFTATDACGNKSVTTATFTIRDTTAPVISPGAASKTVESDGAGNTAALSAWLAAHGGASATDIGSAVTWSHDFTAITTSCASSGAATVTFTATDACGNKSVTTATFTIVDTTKPVLGSDVRNISPNEKPVTFTITSTDVGGASTPSIVSVTATRVNGSGKTLDKTEPYKQSVSGNTVTITTSGGVGTVWTIATSSVDACGNTATASFIVNVVNPTLTK